MDQSPPRPSRRDVSPPRPINRDNSPPRPINRDNSPPRPMRRDVSLPRPTRNSSPPRPTRNNNKSLPRPTRNNNTSPPRPLRDNTNTVSPPRPPRTNTSPARPARTNTSPPRPTRYDQSPPRPSRNNDQSPPRPSRSNISSHRPTLATTMSDRNDDNNNNQNNNNNNENNNNNNQNNNNNHQNNNNNHQNNSQNDENNNSNNDDSDSDQHRDLWSEVSHLVGHSRYSTQAAKRAMSNLVDSEAISQSNDPLYMAHLTEKKEKQRKREEKLKYEKILLEQQQWEMYQAALNAGDVVAVRKYEDKQRVKREIEMANVENHIRLKALQVVQSYHREGIIPSFGSDRDDEEGRKEKRKSTKSGKLLRLVRRPKFQPDSSTQQYSNKFNIPPGYRWDGIDRSIGALNKQREQNK